MSPNRFASLVSRVAGSPPLLPFTHTSDAFFFRDIVASGQLRTSSCPFFSEPLLYLFYGRPAFRPSTTQKATALTAFSLVSFILRAEGLPPPKRMFPFDTGALNKGLYAEFLHPSMTLANFELSCDLREAQKVVELFYGDNGHYFFGRSIAGKSFPILEMEAQCYYSLIQSPGLQEADDRKSTIEAQFANNITLDPGNVMAVIAPEFFWDDEQVVDFVVDGLVAEPLSYDCFHARPSEDTRAITQIARQFLGKRGLV